MSIHLFGIRHHGPGCARSLARALDDLKPDCILVEGPPEADELIHFAAEDGMEPPVALLLYVPDEPKHAVFYPFASFSPEWQAIQHVLKNGVKIRFMDLPQTHSLALRKEQETLPDAPLNENETDETAQEAGETEIQDGETGPCPSDIRRDPLGWLAQAAGYGGGEEWWEHMVEMRQDGSELFMAIAEAMTAVRAESPAPDDAFEIRREALREAHMRKTIRTAQKEGFERIAVVCGAWHVPALAMMPAASADNELLKNLPKLKVEATWIPWTYERLSAESGYGAGVVSPAWYEHLWTHKGQTDPTTWFTRVARLLRKADIDCSSAHVIECVRLSYTLAAVRERPMPGLAEMTDAARTVLTTGEDAPLKLIQRDLIIGNRLGRIPTNVPTVPLQRDLERLQKSLRLKVSATQEMLELDLRNNNDLLRSHLLHRLRLLGVNWGEFTESSSKGTFREIWKLQWQPEFSLTIIEAAPFGNSVAEASAAFVIRTAKETSNLTTLAGMINHLLLADLPSALHEVMQELENRAAVTGDIPQLMAAIPSLTRVLRYGDVRKTDNSQVAHVIDGLIVRVCIGLGTSCQSLDDDAAATMAGLTSELHSAIKLVEKQEQLVSWLSTLEHIADVSGVHHRMTGLCARILFDEHRSPIEDTGKRMSRCLSRGVAPETSAAWLEGFLSGSGMVLVHDQTLLHLVDEWVSGLSADHFTGVLPLIRRTFSTFPPMERRQIGEQIKRGQSAPSVTSQSGTTGDSWDESRVEKLIPVLKTILAIS